LSRSDERLALVAQNSGYSIGVLLSAGLIAAAKDVTCEMFSCSTGSIFG
jgi:hypothetical protein